MADGEMTEAAIHETQGDSSGMISCSAVWMNGVDDEQYN
jgi:hypothetical protein